MLQKCVEDFLNILQAVSRVLLNLRFIKFHFELTHFNGNPSISITFHQITTDNKTDDKFYETEFINIFILFT